MNAEKEALDQLIHDVNSKCASLKSAVVLLRQADTVEGKELLRLMVRQAENLTQAIALHESRWKNLA